MSKRKLVGRIKKFTNSITVEPIIFCNFLAIAFFRVVEQAGIYKVICIQNYQDSRGADCSNLKANPEVEDLVQKDASTVSMYLSLAYLIPAVVSDIFLGAWADKHGRKVNILLGLAGLIIAAFPFSIVLTFPHTSLVLLVVANIIAGISGYISIVVISALAYLTDIVHDKSTLTVRMAHVYVCNAAAAAVGSFAVGYLIKAAPLPYVIMVTEIILFVGFMYALFRIKHIPPLILRRMIHEEVTTGEKSPIKCALTRKSIDIELSPRTGEMVQKEPTTCMGEFVKTIKYVGNMYREVGHTFSRPRPGHRRCYIYLMSLIFFLFLIAELGLLHGPIMSLYVFHRPFYWSPADLGFWKGTQSTLILIGNLAGSWTMKKFLNFRDTTVILVSLGSAVVHLSILALSKSTLVMYLAIVFGMFANLTLPTAKSFVAQLVDADEVGKAYTANAVFADLAFVTSTLLFNNVYSATVEYFPGLVFFFAATLLLICFFIMLWIHIDSSKYDTVDLVKITGKKDIIITRF